MREMKDSGVDVIKEIPITWSVVKTKYVADLYTGNSIKDEEKDYYTDSEDAIPYIATKDITQSNNTIDYSNGLYVKEKDNSFVHAFPESSLMCIEGGSAGRKKAYLDREVCFVNKLCCFKPKNIKGKYLYYYLNSPNYEEEFRQYISGLIGGVSKSKLDNIFIVEPDSDEQEKIVDYLDRKCSAIDNIIAKQEQIIEKLKEYKLSIITEAVTKGLDPDVEMKDSGVEWIGKIPASWKIFRISNLYDQTAEAGSEELPILTVSINTGISDRELDDEEQDRVFVRSEDRTKYKKVRPGDLAYNMMRAWQGAFGAARVDGMVSPAYVTCRPKRGVQIDTRYIEYLLRTPIATEEMHRYSHGIADFRMRLYWPEFKNIRLCLPNLSEQKAMADYLDMKGTAIDKTIHDRENAIEKLNAYKKSLIYEVVTGKKEV